MMEQRHNDDVIISELRNLKEIVSLEVAYLKGMVTELKKQTETQSSQITLLQIWQSNSMGRMAVIFTIVGFGVSLLIGWISKHF